MEYNGSILVVDDEPEICKTLKILFEKKWYEVSYALTGEEAIKKIKERKFNVALLDINLPDIEGTELISVFKRIYSQMEIVIITGHSTTNNAIRALNNGASYYFEKPFKLKEVLTKVHELVERQNKTSFQAILQKLVTPMDTKDIVKLNKLNISLSQDLPFKIQKAIEYIEKNYTNQGLCLKEIAKSVSMHPKSFSFLWCKTVKIKTREYINNLRIAKAKELFLDPTLYVTQIAYKVGFSKQYFCKVFKDKVGYSSTEYRTFFSNAEKL
ncbi:MAG: response regulator [bacterium]|nr:response regulator [bacterium]